MGRIVNVTRYVNTAGALQVRHGGARRGTEEFALYLFGRDGETASRKVLVKLGDIIPDVAHGQLGCWHIGPRLIASVPQAIDLSADVVGWRSSNTKAGGSRATS